MPYSILPATNCDDSRHQQHENYTTTPSSAPSNCLDNSIQQNDVSKVSTKNLEKKVSRILYLIYF